MASVCHVRWHMYVGDLYRILLCIILKHYTPSSSPFDCSAVVSKDTIYTT